MNFTSVVTLIATDATALLLLIRSFLRGKKMKSYIAQNPNEQDSIEILLTTRKERYPALLALIGQVVGELTISMGGDQDTKCRITKYNLEAFTDQLDRLSTEHSLLFSVYTAYILKEFRSELHASTIAMKSQSSVVEFEISSHYEKSFWRLRLH